MNKQIVNTQIDIISNNISKQFWFQTRGVYLIIGVSGITSSIFCNFFSQLPLLSGIICLTILFMLNKYIYFDTIKNKIPYAKDIHNLKVLLENKLTYKNKFFIEGFVSNFLKENNHFYRRISYIGYLFLLSEIIANVK